MTQPNSRFIAAWKAGIRHNFAQRYPQATALPTWDLLAEMAASATIGAYTYWMEHPNAVDEEQAKQLVDQSLSAVMGSLLGTSHPEESHERPESRTHRPTV